MVKLEDRPLESGKTPDVDNQNVSLKDATIGSGDFRLEELRKLREPSSGGITLENDKTTLIADVQNNLRGGQQEPIELAGMPKVPQVPQFNKTDQLVNIAHGVFGAYGGVGARINGQSEIYNNHGGMELVNYLRTDEAPLQSNDYLAMASKPYEKQVMDYLANSKGAITQKLIARACMNACGDDPLLASLTAANVMKNIVTEKREDLSLKVYDSQNYKPSQIYSMSRCTDILNRLEPMADQGVQYDKLGSNYHFPGAVFAGMMGLDGAARAEAVAHDLLGRKSDGVQNEAGVAGETVGFTILSNSQNGTSASLNY